MKNWIRIGPAWFIAEKIVAIVPSGDYTDIHLDNGRVISVTVSVEEIVKAMLD